MKLFKLAIASLAAALSLATAKPAAAQTRDLVYQSLSFDTSHLSLDIPHSPEFKVYGGVLSALDLAFAAGYASTYRNCTTPGTFAHRVGYQHISVFSTVTGRVEQNRTLSCDMAYNLIRAYGIQPGVTRTMYEDMGSYRAARVVPTLNINTDAKANRFRTFRQSITLN